MSETINNIEIFGVGTWNGMKFTKEDLEEIAKNTEVLLSDGKHKPPLKLGHSSNQILKGQDDGDPAMGWIENIRVEGKKLLADFARVPNILVSAFKEGLYRQVSVEMRHIDHTGWVLTGVALLGADLPAVKNLNDLEAFLSEKFDAGNPVDNEEHELCFSTTEPILKGQDMSEVNKELEELRAKLSAVESENASFKSKENERAFSDKKDSFLAPYKEDVESGKLSPAIFSKIEKEIDSKKSEFSEDKEVYISASLLHEVTRAYSQTLPMGESAHSNVETAEVSSVRIDDKIEREIAKVQSASSVDYFSARDLVFKAQPELGDEYKNFTLEISEGRI